MSTREWQVRFALMEDQGALLDLFEKSFNASMTPEQWRWKYAFSNPLGSLVWEENEAVAFYGGMPRSVRWFGRQETAVQIGDVMVEPSRRRIFTRHGPFFRAASFFSEGLVGSGKPYYCAFGFPSARHHRLGEHLGLYGRIGEMLEATWAPLSKSIPLTLKVEPLTESCLPSLEGLWQAMADNLGQAVVLARAPEDIRHRYLGHPTIEYASFLVRRRFTQKPLGALMMRDHGEAGMEILDLVGPLEHMGSLIGIARTLTAKLGRKRLFAWLTALVAEQLRETAPVVNTLDLPLPTIIWGQPSGVLDSCGKWWLMGGDADFR